MDQLHIYDNVEEPSSNHRKWKREIKNSEVIYQNQDPNRIGPGLSGLGDRKTIKKSSCRVAVVILGLLCLLILGGLLALVFLYINLTKEKEQLQEVLDIIPEELLRKIQALHSEGWMYLGSSFYYVSTERKSWQDSQDDCLQRGANLIIINSLEEQKFTNMFQKRIWIGLTDRETEGTWKWVDGSPLTTSYFAKSEPNNGTEEDCAETLRYHLDYSWNDAPCNNKKIWICEKLLL